MTKIPDGVLRYSFASAYVGDFLVPHAIQQIGMGEKPPFIRSRYLCSGPQCSELGLGTRAMPLGPRGRPPTRVVPKCRALEIYNLLYKVPRRKLSRSDPFQS
jgi:hypothetical protein